MIRVTGLRKRFGNSEILKGIDFEVPPKTVLGVIGASGSGKSTLLRIASLYLHPSRGTVRVLGEELGRTDVRQLRRRVGYTAAAFADLLADLSNVYAGVHFAAPAATALERSLVRWLADLVGYPETAGGDLTSGGSVAHLEGLVTAREATGLRPAEGANR